MPGDLITYTLYLTNTGNLTDTYDLLITATWTTVSTTPVGPLATGDSAILAVVVQVPPDAAWGNSDTATVTIASQGDASQMQVLSLTTSIDYRVYLPVVEK
jgi:hypothetical protein